MKIGYARISTDTQNLALQLDALKKEGCEEIFQEQISGSTKERPELTRMKTILRDGDTVVVWRLDRLGRSLVNIINLVLELRARGVNIKGLNDGVDTSTSSGRLMLNIMASLAEYERELIRERTFAGLKAARARGRLGGRPTGLKFETVAKIKAIRNLSKDLTKEHRDIYEALNLSRGSYYRYLNMVKKYSNEQLNQLVIKKRK